MEGRAAELRDHEGRPRLDQELRSALAEDRERDLIRHRRGRQVDGLVLAEERGRALLERGHRRILASLLVADLGLRHRGPHPGGRLRLRVRAEVDHGGQAYPQNRCRTPELTPEPEARSRVVAARDSVVTTSGTAETT